MHVYIDTTPRRLKAMLAIWMVCVVALIATMTINIHPILKIVDTVVVAMSTPDEVEYSYLHHVPNRTEDVEPFKAVAVVVAILLMFVIGEWIETKIKGRKRSP